MEVTNSCRGYPGYPHYRPFEIKRLRRIARLGIRRGYIGRFQWAFLAFPFMVQQFFFSSWYMFVFRRNSMYTKDESREVKNRLYPLFKHAEEKCKFNDADVLKLKSNMAAMELGDDFDYDQLRIYHYPYRHPDETMLPGESTLKGH